MPELAVQLFNPENLQLMLRTYGLSELVIPEAQSGQKQMEEIEELLGGVPVEPIPEEIQQAQAQYDMQLQVSQQSGLPAPPPFDPQSLVRSSVPVKPWDHDEWEAQKCQDWLNSDACRIESQIGRPDPLTRELVPNVRGVQNVELHRQEHLKAAALKNPPPPPMPAGPAPKGKASPPRPAGVMPGAVAALPGGAVGTQTV
jgi:hypothetical protein